MKRLGIAIAGVVALVAAAFAVRAARGDDAATDTERPTRVLCATDMAAACAALADVATEVRVEPAPTTIARLAAGDVLQADAWLVPKPWLDLALAAVPAGPERAAPLADVSGTLARSPLALVVRSDRRPALESSCNGTIDWRCLARRNGEPWTTAGGDPAWGRVSIAVDDPARRTVGLLALAQVGAAFTRRPVFDARDEASVREALTIVLAALPAPTVERTTLEQMLEVGGSFDGAFALESETRLAIASPRASGQLELVAPEPPVAADAVLVRSTGSPRAVDEEAARRALTSTGWQFPDRSEPNVPDAASLQALRALWVAARPAR